MQIPSHFQIYSDMYKKYLHFLDDIFRACIMSEKEWLNKMNINENITKSINQYTDYLTKIWINQIENYDIYLKMYSKMRISNMKTYDKFVHKMMDTHAKLLANNTRNYDK